MSKPCACGRSPDGCVGLHVLTNEQYIKYLEKKQHEQNQLKEQANPKLLID